MARSRLLIPETVPIKSNLKLLARERGKIVRGTRREGHNIWLNAGRVWLANLISYASYSPLAGQENNRIRYMGFGIGGTRQNSPGVANVYPLGPGGAPGGVPDGYYPGTNVQTDTDPAITQLERPVRLSSPNPSLPSVPPAYADADDVWLGEVQVPPVHSPTTSAKFTRIFTQDEISYGPFLTVPLSEIGLFPNSASSTYIHLPHNQPVAYDTFDTLSNTSAFEVEVEWTVRF